VGLGRQQGTDLHMVYMVQGLVRRGEEIWQYYLGTGGYHSPWKPGLTYQLYRVVQRLDGFVSADADYTGGMLQTKPLVCRGNRLVLNIDTAATGYAQVGFLDEKGQPIPGYSVGECVYINGDGTQAEVEWLRQGKDLSALAGRKVQLVFRMRGTKLYAMQLWSK